MLLRPTKYWYSVVGACYVQGFMDAEALLGPLPEDWKGPSRLRDTSEESETGPTARRLADDKKGREYI